MQAGESSINAEAVMAELDLILASGEYQGLERRRWLLRYLVERALAGAEKIGELARPLVTVCGAGAIGSHLCDRLLYEGHEVIGMDNFITGDPQRNVLYVPKQAVFMKNGKRVVYVKNGNAFEEHAVKVAAETESRSAIEGVNAGTEIAFVDPTVQRKSAATPAATPTMGGPH